MKEPVWQVFQQGVWYDFPQVLNSVIETAYTTDKPTTGLYMRPVTVVGDNDFYIDFVCMQEINLTRRTWACVQRDIRKSRRPAPDLIEQFVRFQIEILQIQFSSSTQNDCHKLRFMCSLCGHVKLVHDHGKGIEPDQTCPLCSGKLIRGHMCATTSDEESVRLEVS